jgi:hypothetical protein
MFVKIMQLGMDSTTCRSKSRERFIGKIGLVNAMFALAPPNLHGYDGRFEVATK